MLESITINFENCSNVYKSNNSKKNLKKYIKKILDKQDEAKYLDILYNGNDYIRRNRNRNINK